jgi:Mg-chelatase subunit ChlD
VLVEQDLARYQLLASAVAGCGVRVERAPEGEASYTDGHTIFLAAAGGRRADLSGLAVQGALLAAGSLDQALLKRMVGRPSLGRRYLTIEGWRALAAIADLLPGVPVVARARRTELWSSSPEESLAVAISRRPVPEAPEVFGVIRPRRVLAAGPVEEAGVPTAQDLARQQLTEEDIPTFDEDDETEDIGKIAKLFSSPLQSGLMQKLAKKMGLGKEPGSGAGGAELPHGGTRTTTRPGSKASLSLLPASLLPTEVLSERGFGWRYPEWDANAGRYRPEWCTVMEVDPRPEDLKVFNPPPSRDLRRRLARLGVGLERHRRQPQGDDIDVDAAVESRVELLAGSTPDDGVYLESQRRKRSLAVLILLDISGSAAERTTPRASVHERQREAAAALLDTLHVLGDRIALYGFRSHGASAVYMVRVKCFEDVLNGVCMERLGGLVPGGYTRLGAAIRHSAHVLDTRAGTDRRLLLVLSDGFPYDDGYEGSYGEADSRRALSETRRQGIGCLCLTLGASTDTEALKRVFGTAAHASAPRLEDLTPHIGPLFRRAMSSADLQRRLAQRNRRSEQETKKGVA